MPAMPSVPLPPSPIEPPERELGKPLTGWRLRLYTVIFEADTRAGRAFDLALIAMILASVAVVVLDSVASIHQHYGPWLKGLEWFFTAAFTVEYIARLLCVRHPCFPGCRSTRCSRRSSPRSRWGSSTC